VLEHHGWQDVGMELHRLSKEGKWTELPKQISDEMLEEWAIISTYDKLAETVIERCTGIYDTVLLDLPPGIRDDRDRVKDIVAKLHAA
jgi:hypothetical protein